MKKIYFFALICFGQITNVIAQPKVPKLIIRVTSDDDPPRALQGVFISAKNGNTQVTKGPNAECEIFFQEEREGNSVELTVTETENYFVLDKEQLKAILRNDPEHNPHRIIMKNKQAYKSEIYSKNAEITDNIYKLNKKIDALKIQIETNKNSNLQLNKTLIDNMHSYEAELKASLNERKDLIQSIDIKFNEFKNEFKRLNTLDTLTLQNLLGVQKEISNFNERYNNSLKTKSLAPESKWNLIKSEDVRLDFRETTLTLQNKNLYKGPVIRFDIQLKRIFKENDLDVRVCFGLNKNKKETSFFVLKNSASNSELIITWPFKLDSVDEKEIVPERMQIFVYRKDNLPDRPSSPILGITSSALGIGAVVYSSILENQASLDYNIYKTKINENDPIYNNSPTGRADLYTKANSKHKIGQFLLGGGGVLTVLGAVQCLRFIAAHKERKRSDFYASDFIIKKRKLVLEPILASGNNVGFGINLNF